MDITTAIGDSRAALDAFATGDSGPVEALYSHADDVILANPFGSTAVGWADVRDAARFAASRFRDGSVPQVDTLAMCVTDTLAIVFDVEHWEARVGERPDVTPFELRVSTTWRLEDGAWKIAQRHADPIRTLDADGPLRST